MIDSESLEFLSQYISQQRFTKLRIGVIDDPTIGRVINDGVNYDPMETKTSPENSSSQTREKSARTNGINAVNALTGMVSIRWIDGDGMGIISPSSQRIPEFVNQAISLANLADAIEPVINLSMGLWGGTHPGTGLITVCGFEFLPPVGSVVVVGIGPQNRSIILGYFLPNYIKVFNSTNSQYNPIQAGEIRLTSYGGSYFHLKNLRNNSQFDIANQVADIEIGHVLGGGLSFSSTRGDKNGVFSVTHPSGTSMVIDDNGSFLLKNKAIPDYTSNEKTLVSSKFELLKNGSIAFNSVADILISAFTNLKLQTKDILDFVTNSFSLKVKANTNIELNDITAGIFGKVSATILDQTEIIFTGDTVIEAKSNLKIKANGSMKIAQDGSIVLTSAKGNIDLVATGPDPISMGGVVTAQTVCPVSGLHMGAIANTVRASNITPSSPGVSL